MPGSRSGYTQGIPQSTQPYTKWNADKDDEVELDYKDLDGPQGEGKRKPSCFHGPLGTILKILLFLVVFAVGLILGYMLRKTMNDPLPPSWKCPYTEGLETYSSDISKELHVKLDLSQFADKVRNYSENVHLSATKLNIALEESLKKHMREYKLAVSEAKYKVLLSYPDWESPNVVYVLNSTGSVIYRTEYNGPSHKHHPEQTKVYSGFSSNGTVEGCLVYANYGQLEDFKTLKIGENGCKVTIAMIRYGKIASNVKVRNAERHGVAGVILYTDQRDVIDKDQPDVQVYPDSWYLPGWAVQSGSVLPDMIGDPLTPTFPSTDGVYRVAQSKARLPKIPVQPIGYAHADEILRLLHQNVLNTTVGNDSSMESTNDKRKVRLEVNNFVEQRPITDVFGVIKGKEESDRYIIVGCHYDSWAFGAMDSGVGSALMMEVSRAFTKMMENGWQPRRTILFAFWDASEQGLMGSYEFVQEYEKELAERVVAYINLNRPVQGNYTLRVEASPLLHTLVKNTTRLVSPAVVTEQKDSLYDVWRKNSPSSDDKAVPRIHLPEPDGDHAAFLYTLGVPVIWPFYTYKNSDNQAIPYPAYHTAADTYQYFTKFVDPELKATQAMADLVLELILQLSSHTKLPFDCREMAAFLGKEVDALRSTLGTRFTQTLDHLKWAVGNFSDLSEDFHQRYLTVDPGDVLECRRLNDRLMKLSQAFVYSPGLPDRPQFRNILFAPSLMNNVVALTFTGIRDAFTTYVNSSNRSVSLEEDVEKQITIATLAIQAASRTLSSDPFHRGSTDD